MKKVILPAVLTLALGTSVGYNYVQYSDNNKLDIELGKAVNEIKKEKDNVDKLSERVDELTNLYENMQSSFDTVAGEKIELEKQLESKDNAMKKLKAELEKTKASQKVAVTAQKTSVPSRGEQSAVQKTMYMTATAYTAYCNGCSGITKTGINLRANPNAKVIAVDPNVIPLGSKVYVEGYGYAIAGDTGGAIKGNIVDLHMPTKDAAYTFGRQHNVKVQILN